MRIGISCYSTFGGSGVVATEVGKALAARGDFEAAVDQLLTIIGRDREWNDQAARKQLLVVFEAAGPLSDVAKQGRRKLSALLFS